MKKSILSMLILLFVSMTCSAAPLTNYSFPNFEIDAKLKGFGQVNPSSALQSSFGGANYDFCYDAGATLGLIGGFAVNAQITTDRIGGNTNGLPVNYNSFEANIMYNLLDIPFLPTINVYAGLVHNFNGAITLNNISQQAANIGDNNGWQAGAQIVYGVPLIGSVYAAGAYGNTRATWEAGLAVPLAVVFDIDAGYKYTQYGGTIDDNQKLVFQGPFLGATFRL